MGSLIWSLYSKLQKLVFVLHPEDMGNLFSRPPPTINVRQYNYRIEEYSTVELQCDLRNAHECTCVWSFRRQDHPGAVMYPTESYKYTINHINQDRCSLKIRDVTKNDQGFYTCKVTNRSGDSASGDTRVEVYSKVEDFRWYDANQKNDIQKKIDGAPFTRNNAGIIVFGLVGAGKSSFINSVKTAMTGRIAVPAPQGGSPISTSAKISYINIDGLPVTICDIPGFERFYDTSKDFLIRDIILNRVAHGTEYTDWKRDNDKGVYRTENEGGMQDPKWCVVYVHNCKDTEKLSDETYHMIRSQERRIRNLDCQMVIVLTKIDKLEDKEVSEIYRGQELRNVMREVSEKTTVDIMNIYPVQNYSSERKNFINMDILLLTAVSRILDRLEDTK